MNCCYCGSFFRGCLGILGVYKSWQITYWLGFSMLREIGKSPAPDPKTPTMSTILYPHDSIAFPTSTVTSRFKNLSHNHDSHAISTKPPCDMSHSQVFYTFLPHPKMPNTLQKPRHTTSVKNFTKTTPHHKCQILYKNHAAPQVSNTLQKPRHTTSVKNLT